MIMPVLVRLVIAALHKISSLQTDVRLLTKTQILGVSLGVEMIRISRIPAFINTDNG